MLWSWLPGALPSGLALSAIGMLLATVLMLLSGAAARASPQAVPIFALFCVGWVVAGLLNAGIGALQVFCAEWPDGDWIARSGLAGRAVGNLRQPNHLSSLLLWSAIAIVPLLELGRLRRGLVWALFALMSFAVVLTASRTGVLGVACWRCGACSIGACRAPRARCCCCRRCCMRWPGWACPPGPKPAATPLVARRGWPRRTCRARASASGRTRWRLIRQQPWTGVGFGEFNLAWSLTPFPGRPVAFFDHTHNLPLQLAVELGLPLAAGGAGLAGGGAVARLAPEPA